MTSALISPASTGLSSVMHPILSHLQPSHSQLPIPPPDPPLKRERELCLALGLGLLNLSPPLLSCILDSIPLYLALSLLSGWIHLPLCPGTISDLNHWC